jgi:hypothetical protein
MKEHQPVKRFVLAAGAFLALAAAAPAQPSGSPVPGLPSVSPAPGQDRANISPLEVPAGWTPKVCVPEMRPAVRVVYCSERMAFCRPQTRFLDFVRHCCGLDDGDECGQCALHTKTVLIKKVVPAPDVMKCVPKDAPAACGPAVGSPPGIPPFPGPTIGMPPIVLPPARK